MVDPPSGPAKEKEAADLKETRAAIESSNQLLALYHIWGTSVGVFRDYYGALVS